MKVNWKLEGIGKAEREKTKTVLGIEAVERNPVTIRI